MKIVTLKVPICDNYCNVAELSKNDYGCSSEEEYLAYLSLNGICSEFHDAETACHMSDYFMELVHMVYNKELAWETRQDPRKKGGLYDA